MAVSVLLIAVSFSGIIILFVVLRCSGASMMWLYSGVGWVISSVNRCGWVWWSMSRVSVRFCVMISIVGLFCCSSSVLVVTVVFILMVFSVSFVGMM